MELLNDASKEEATPKSAAVACPRTGCGFHLKDQRRRKAQQRPKENAAPAGVAVAGPKARLSPIAFLLPRVNECSSESTAATS
uniref:Uncharacterized protein n=1 Tax=Oryza glumipatula TaxID=40148 RepID=A0A0E0ALX0_9ORYZ